MTQTTVQQTEVREMLIENARSMQKVLRDATLEIDQTSKIPDEIVQMIRDKGLLKVLRPKMFGGFQTDMRTYFEVVTEISRGNGSAGWFVTLSNIRDYMVSYAFGRKALTEIFGENRDNDVILAGNFKPVHIDLERVEGGYLVKKAQWPFVSGSPYADWFYSGAPVDDGKGGQEMAIFIVPRQDVTVLDDWDVVGLKGSGSNSIVMENVFIPDHRVSLDRLAVQGHYIIDELKDEPLYRTPFVPSLTLSIVAPTLGLALGGFDLHMERVMKAGIGNTFYQKMSEAPITHLQIAEAEMKIEAARLMFIDVLNKLDGYSHEGKVFSQKESIRMKAEFGFANQLCKESFDLMLAGAGSVFAYNSNVFQAFYRDFITMHLHAFITPSSLLETHGRILCDLEPNTYFA
ncbi:Acyl-CoA dehydrogenase [Psychrobacillus psychrotolerans]|uniref:Acyl-CoA dehydrogenase n=1 Tax=Psychrobacillus psychrotolerans TaxID=126156 RepID=A0A1I6B688_9BACI|nr:acyl-CoA dehydrogenase family protein [Psychrobacillus psychrotolerans]SFQ76307.1 Acyl-CoA dehydrogenase [Psychrobacillus psychrotolerans]